MLFCTQKGMKIKQHGVNLIFINQICITGGVTASIKTCRMSVSTLDDIENDSVLKLHVQSKYD